jgi:hypothetical protein
VAHLGEVLLASGRRARAPNNQPPPASVFVLWYYFNSKTSTKVQILTQLAHTTKPVTLHLRLNRASIEP